MVRNQSLCLIVISTIVACQIFGGSAHGQAGAPTTEPVWVAAEVVDRPVVYLWPQGAPGSEGQNGEEHTRLSAPINGEHVVSGIHHPSLTIYLPEKSKATGAAIVIAPGGGHTDLWLDHEGYNVAQWFCDHGIAAFILKYRLAKDRSHPPGTPQPYQVAVQSLADAQRAIRLVRSRAGEWGINPQHVGIIGFSAGGEVAALAAMHYDDGDATASDSVDRLGCKPDFQGLIYPGSSRTIVPTKDSPPAFLACGVNDRTDISEGLANVYLLFKRAGVDAELHIYSNTGHGFGLRAENHGTAASWPEEFRLWLDAKGFLKN